jgi:hypothetical protein
MAITANAIVVVKTPLEGDWVWASLYSADLSGGEDLVAAVTGKCIYVQQVLVAGASVTDLTVTLGAAQDTGVTTIYLGPIPLSDQGSYIPIDFGPDHCMKVASATAFSVDASGAGVVSVLVKYKIAS